MALNYSSIEVRLGMFLAFCLALFAAMMLSFGKMSPVWKGSQELIVAFENISGIRPDAPVRFNGLEVGRVKWVKVLHLDDATLERFPELTRRDLDNLPLRPETLRRKLREVPEADFNTVCRKHLKDRTMIELCLEVLQEGDLKRYRQDDQVRIVSTVLGDNAIEIMSGSGALNLESKNKIIIGVSGDFFSNLAKSMGDVREVLSNVTDVVGAEERRSFERSQARMGNITGGLESLADLANVRTEKTREKIDKLSESSVAKMNELSGMMESLRPKTEKTMENVRANLSKIQDHAAATGDEVAKQFKDISADYEIIAKDVKEVMDSSKPNFEDMKLKIRGVYDSMGGLSGKLDNMRGTAGRLMVQSEKDVVRFQEAVKNSLTNFRQVGQAALENKDLMLSMRDVGEYEYNTAVVTYRQLTVATRRMRDTGADLQELLRAISEVSPASPQLTRVEKALSDLAVMRQKVDFVRDRVEETLLPEFEHKRSAWKYEPAPVK